MLDIQRCASTSALPAGCEALFGIGEQDSFDLSADWFQLLLAEVFPESSTQIYVMQRDGEVRGVLPLCFRRTAMGLRQAGSLTNYYSSLFRPLLDPAVTADELAGYLREIIKRARVDVLRFDAMDPAHPAFELLESAIRQAGLNSYRFSCFGNWYLPVRVDSFRSYFQGLSSRIRHTVRRREKKFFADGRGRLEIVTGKDGLEAAIAAWEKIYAASWKKAEPFPEFVPGLIRMCAARGWLRLGLAYQDGEPVAGQIWIVSNGRAAIYKLSYDEKFSHLSVGTILTAHLMRHVLDVDRVKEVDYLIGDDEYKKDWMSHRRERWGIVAYNPYTLGGIAGAAVQIMGIFRRVLLHRLDDYLPGQSMQIIENNVLQDGDSVGKAGWSIIPLQKSLGPYKEIWDGLNAGLYASNPYFDSHFVEPLLNCFASGQERLCIHRRAAEIDGLLIVTPSRMGKWSLFIPAQAQIVPILVRHAGDMQKLIHALPGLSLGLALPCQDPLCSPSFASLRTLLWGPVHHAHTMSVRLDGAFEDYWDARSANLRKSVGRRLRKVRDAGLEIGLKRLTDTGDMQSAIARFGALESAGWKGRGGSAVHADNVQGRFYAEVMKRFAGCGRATIYELYFNDDLVAMQLCISSAGMLVLLKTTYDENCASLSPGRLLLRAFLEQEFAEKRVQEVEFYTNADNEQLAWATHQRWVSDYLLFRNRLSWVAYQKMKRLKHGVHGKRPAKRSCNN
jgi:CelD/BcsL family acetyltransferase involved in cellulose biosynthesis